jgi:hypothetical protein
VAERQGRRRRMLLDDHKERRGYAYLKEESLDRNKWRAHMHSPHLCDLFYFAAPVLVNGITWLFA